MIFLLPVSSELCLLGWNGPFPGYTGFILCRIDGFSRTSSMGFIAGGRFRGWWEVILMLFDTPIRGWDHHRYTRIFRFHLL
jgi:hypothetical protein